MTGHSSSSSLLLDPDIRNWVLLPIVLIMVLVGMCRTYITQLLASDAAGVKVKELKNRYGCSSPARFSVCLRTPVVQERCGSGAAFATGRGLRVVSCCRAKKGTTSRTHTATQQHSAPEVCSNISLAQTHNNPAF